MADLLADKIRNSNGTLKSHVIRGDVNVANATLAATQANMQVAISALFLPNRSAVLAVQAGNMNVAIQSRFTPMPSRVLRADTIRDGDGNLKAHSIRGDSGVVLNIQGADMAVAIAATASGPVRQAAIATQFDMMGQMAGVGTASDGFNAALSVHHADMIAALTAHSAAPSVFNAAMAVTEDDMLAAFSATFVPHYFTRLDVRAEDMVAALSMEAINATVDAELNATLGDMLVDIGLHANALGVADAVLAFSLEDMNASIEATFQGQTRDAQFDIVYADMRARIFLLQKPVEGTWPGASNVVGLRVRAKNKPLIVRGTRSP